MEPCSGQFRSCVYPQVLYKKSPVKIYLHASCANAVQVWMCVYSWTLLHIKIFSAVYEEFSSVCADKEVLKKTTMHRMVTTFWDTENICVRKHIQHMISTDRWDALQCWKKNQKEQFVLRNLCHQILQMLLYVQLQFLGVSHARMLRIVQHLPKCWTTLSIRHGLYLKAEVLQWSPASKT
jgi:hypothetical protein